MSPGRLDILTEALTAIARLIMAARSDRDAEAIVHQLRALGPAQRSDVGSIEAERLRELRQDEPTQSTRQPRHIGGGTCGICHQPYAMCVCDPMTVSPPRDGE